MPTNRHVHIGDLVTAVKSRITTLCTTLDSVDSTQATNYEALVKLATNWQHLPAAIVVMGPFETDDGIGAPARRVRNINLGVLLISEYDGGFDRGSTELWALLDEVDDAFMPAESRGEDVTKPVTILQDWLIPSGWTPVEAKQRAAGVYNLIVVDPVKSRS